MHLSVDSQVERAISRNRSGKIFFAKDFQKIGSNDAVRKTLSRLTKKGVINRVSRGVYYKPRQSDLFGESSPTLDQIIRAIARRDKIRLIPTGMSALNRLGLSNQVPMNPVYLIDGYHRTLTIGKHKVKFKTASPKILAIKNDDVQLLVQALKTLGKDEISDRDNQRIEEIVKRINQNELIRDLKYAPEWIRRLLLKLRH